MKKAVLILLSVIAVSGLILYLASDKLSGETLECRAFENGKDGWFVRLTDGETHYAMRGPVDRGEYVVLIHGVQGPMQVWDKTFEALAKDNRVLRYDLYGRGRSQRVSADYSAELFDRQLVELLSMLSAPEPVVLVGSSMGAIIASEFYLRHPEKVKKLVLVGPAGFPIVASPLRKVMNVPVLGDIAMSVFGTKTLQVHNRAYFKEPENFPEVRAAFVDQLRCRGTKAGILSTMRNMPVQNYQEGYEKIGKAQIPVLLIWGEYDRTFPFENHKKALAWIPRAKFVAIPDAAHLPQYERPEPVNAAIASFLEGGIQ